MQKLELFVYLTVSDSAAAIRFYAAAFGATERFRLAEPSGRIGHAEIDLGGHTVMLADEFPEHGLRSPRSIGGTPVTMHLHVEDADAAVERAVAAGARLTMPVRDHFYGERGGAIEDPFGHRWLIGHSIEEVSPLEMQRRYTAMLDSAG